MRRPARSAISRSAISRSAISRSAISRSAIRCRPYPGACDTYGYDCGGPAWRLWHYTSGRWTGPALPTIGGTAGLVAGIAAVPGTRSAWAAGTRFTNSATDGVILAKGRLPSLRSAGPDGRKAF